MNATDRRLPALIQRRIDAGDSERAIAARAQSKGHKISHAHLNNLRRGLVAKAPGSDDIAAIAAGLMVSESVVRAAVFMDWYGYDVDRGQGGTADPVRDAIDRSRLSDRDKEILLAQLDVMRERSGTGEETQESERFA